MKSDRRTSRLRRNDYARKLRAWLVLASMVVGGVVPGTASSAGINPVQLARLLARCIGFDKNLTRRAHGSVVVSFLGAPQSQPAQSQADCSGLQKAFSALNGIRVQGLPIATDPEPIVSTDAFEHQLEERHTTVLFVCAGRSDATATISKVTRKLQVLTIAADREDVVRGLTLGTKQDGEKIGITVNLKAAVQESVALSDTLLSVAEQVDK